MDLPFDGVVSTSMLGYKRSIKLRKFSENVTVAKEWDPKPPDTRDILHSKGYRMKYLKSVFWSGFSKHRTLQRWSKSSR